MTRPRVYCDFNDRIDRTTYGLRVKGTLSDLEGQRLRLTPGLELTLYDHDSFENGDAAWIVADAVVVTEPAVGLVARVDPETFRWEPRIDHDARIHWSPEQLRLGLPNTLESVDPAWFPDDASEGWSLVCRFSSPPSEQGSPSTATIRFLVDDAPHRRLRPGVVLRLFERASQRHAIVEVLD